jgi:uncharacterized membrane protein YdfJ with MMPL/SSD domain
MVIVPAVMQILGDRSWWLPGWLDRLIPAREPGAGARLTGYPARVHE